MNQSILPLIVVVAGVSLGVLLYFLKKTRRKKSEKTQKDNTKDTSEPKTSVQTAVVEAIKKDPQPYVLYAIAGGIFLVILATVAILSPSSLPPYILAPLMAGFAYFFSDKKKYKNLTYAIWVGVATAVAITLWIFPDVLRMVTDPFIGDWSLKEFAGADNFKLYVLAGGILFLLLLSGYAYEAIILGVILLILW